jgi:hypothetical protein
VEPRAQGDRPEEEQSRIRRHLAAVGPTLEFQQADAIPDIPALPVQIDGQVCEDEGIVCTFSVTKPHKHESVLTF